MGPIVQTMWMVIIAAAQLGTLAQLAKQVFMATDFQTFLRELVKVYYSYI
jgi:hypothetical protein